MTPTGYITNSKARFEYFVEETFTAGVVLKGKQVKEIRGGRVTLTDTFAHLQGNSVISNINVSGSPETILLLTKKELRKLRGEVKKPGYTLVPLKLFFSHGLVKCELGLCKGKKQYDKRQAIKERDLKREQERY